MKQPYSHFDLPRQHLGPEGHYAPPKSRDPVEIARRRELRPGTLLAEYQAKGIDLSHKLLERTEVGSDMRYVTHLLGMLTINSSWYLFAKDAPDVMRRRLLLPRVARFEDDRRVTAEEQRVKTLSGLAIASDMAADFTDRYARNKLSVSRAQQFARHLGNVSLDLAVLGDGQTVIGGDAFEVQKHVRGQALDLLEYARQAGAEMGAAPSVAQLPDQYSPASLDIHKNAPDNVAHNYAVILDEAA